MIPERRATKFTEILSIFMVRTAAVGAFIVLVDIKFTLTIYEQIVTIGSGFSPDLKGAVIASILISGYTAVKEYWLGASASGQNQSESMSRIAEAAAPATAAAVAASSSSSPMKVDEVKIDANTATVNEVAPQPPPKGNP